MTFLQAIILGIIQGATEFLPISSSGHLVLIPNLLGWDIPPKQAFAFDVILQAATLIAVFSFFFDDLRKIILGVLQGIKEKSLSNPNLVLGINLIIATIPAGIIGLLFNALFQNAFNNPKITAYFLFINAIFLVIAEFVGKRNRSFGKIIWIDALWVGFFQILALFPGISRSGTTITAGMLRNLDRQTSARFSFLISIPLMIAAGLNGFQHLISLPNTLSLFPVFLTGSIVAGIVGFISIKWLLNFLTNHSFIAFSIYCIAFAFVNLIIISRQ